jgi:hypothetical protein
VPETVDWHGCKAFVIAARVAERFLFFRNRTASDEAVSFQEEIIR